MSDSSLPTCGDVSDSSVDATTSDSPVSSCSNSNLSSATVEEIVNWTLGTRLLDGFYPDETYELYNKGTPVYYEDSFLVASYYPANLGTGFDNYDPSNYRDASTIGKNNYSDSLFGGGYYGEKLPMYAFLLEQTPVSDVDNSYSTSKQKMGNLTYNVPASSQSFPDTSIDGYYQAFGSTIEDYSLGFLVPDEDYAEFWDDSSAPVSTQQDVISDVTVTASLAPSLTETYTIPAYGSYSTTNASLVERAWAAKFNLNYKLEEQIKSGLGGLLSDSVTEEVKAALEIDFSSENDKFSKENATVSFTENSYVKNKTGQTVYYEWVVIEDNYTANFTLPGYLTANLSNVDELSTESGVSESPDSDQIYSEYENKNGKKIKYYNTESVYNLLSDTASSDSGFSKTYNSSISPKNQTVTAAGTYSANNPTKIELFFFFDDDDSCGSIDTETLSDDCPPPSSRLARSARHGSSATKLSLKNLQKLHDEVYVNNHEVIKLEDESGKRNLKIGSRGETKSGLYNIGTNESDYHFNPSKKFHGAAILHEGNDFYYGHKKKDFVSSKSLGGTSSIRTKGGKDRVLIDASASYDEITHGYTHLGTGADKYKVIGSENNVDPNDYQAEFVETGSGKDKIFVDGNVKLVVTDFDPFKDELIIDFENYRMTGNYADISFVNDEGSTITLQGLATSIHRSDRFDRDSVPGFIDLVEPHSDPYISDIHKFAYSQITGFVAFPSTSIANL